MFQWSTISMKIVFDMFYHQNAHITPDVPFPFPIIDIIIAFMHGNGSPL